MADASLRGQLLRLLLLPVAGILAVSSVAAYYLAREPATDAYDGALIDAGIALADRIHVRDGTLAVDRSEEHTSELQSPCNLVCRLLLEKKKKSNETPNGPTISREHVITSIATTTPHTRTPQR